MELMTPSDRTHAVWGKTMRNIKEMIETARLQLEGPLGIDETNRVRGRLIALRALERMDHDDPNVQ